MSKHFTGFKAEDVERATALFTEAEALADRAWDDWCAGHRLITTAKEKVAEAIKKREEATEIMTPTNIREIGG